KYRELIETYRGETGSSPDQYNLTVTADVHTVVQTTYGRIDEVFSQPLNLIPTGSTLERDVDLFKSTPGSLTKIVMVPNPEKYLGLSVAGISTLFASLTISFALLTLVFAVLFILSKPKDLLRTEKEAVSLKKKYGQRILETISEEPVKEEKIISLSSIEDLISVSDEIGKPIVHRTPTTPEQVHTYYVFDGFTCYRYSLTSE
ncbi:DUF5305 family protein, partial [Chloroflexota bacterium]